MALHKGGQKSTRYTDPSTYHAADITFNGKSYYKIQSMGVLRNYIFVLILISCLCGKSPAKGLQSAVFGMMVAIAGLTRLDSVKRYASTVYFIRYYTAPSVSGNGMTR